MAAPLDGGAQYGYLVTFVLPDRLGPAAEDRNRCPGRPEPTSGTARHNLITLRRVPRAERSREQGSLCSSADERDVAVMATKAIVGEKIGMTQVWDDENRVVPVTVLRVKPCRVVKVKTDERDGYTALQVTFGTKKASKITKPKLGQFEKAGVEPGPRLVELRLDDVSEYSVGQELKADLLSNGDKVDVTAVSKGKGFAGAMKRHGFGGMPASHGTHRTHRAPGSVGACATPSRVFKGQRMAGRMGGEKVTTLNLLVVTADADRDIVLVRGSVPGPKGGLVLIRNAVKADV